MSEEAKTPVHIAEFQIENVKRVRAVEWRPGEGLTVIGGRNCQGKSSVLDAIAYALGGERLCPSQVQNLDGVAPARMEVTLSNGLVVRREGKNHALKVSDPSGMKAGQRLLDSLIGEFALNLPAFLNADTRRKASILLKTLGIEEQLAALENEERKAAEERLLLGREARRKKDLAEGLPEYPEAPAETLSGAELARELQAAMSENAAHQAARANLSHLKARAEVAQSRKCELEERLAQARRDLAGAEKELEEADNAFQKAFETPIAPDIDTAAIQARIDELDATNQKVMVNQAKAKAASEAAAAAEAYTAAGNAVDAIRARLLEFLKSVKMPLEGLSVEEGELVYRGQKWDNMSGMERILVGISISQAVKPSCGFVLLDGLETFDAEQLEKLRGWLGERKLQAIATRVATDDTCDLIIEDGMVASEPSGGTSPEPSVPSGEAPGEMDF